MSEAVLPGSANNRPTAQRKTTPEGVAVDRVVSGYAFLRLAIPTSPSRPEPNSQTAAGTGTKVALDVNEVVDVQFSMSAGAWIADSGLIFVEENENCSLVAVNPFNARPENVTAVASNVLSAVETFPK